MMINEIDKKILLILNQDARTSHAKIAEEVGISRPAVAERVRKLEQSGLIIGYSAVLNPESLDQNIAAFISAKHPGIVDASCQTALKKLAENPDILEVHSIAGEDCFLIKVRTTDMKGLNNIINSLKEKPLLMTTKTTIVLERYFEKVGGVILK